MGFYDQEKNVKDYIRMAEGYDGRELINLLTKYLPQEATVLELGMGPGIDLDILKEYYEVTGSDYSSIFLNLYRQKYPNADLLLLDAVTLQTHRKFDCIYSNKVLHHLSREDLKTSLECQQNKLNANGLLMHSFWYGNKIEEMHGLTFNYYTEKDLSDIIGDAYDILEIEKYTEMEAGDSIYVLMRLAGIKKDK